jgi:hypothetical protein
METIKRIIRLTKKINYIKDLNEEYLEYFQKCVMDMKIGNYVSINTMLNMIGRNLMIYLVKNVIQYSLNIATTNILEDL